MENMNKKIEESIRNLNFRYCNYFVDFINKKSVLNQQCKKELDEILETAAHDSSLETYKRMKKVVQKYDAKIAEEEAKFKSKISELESRLQ